MVMVMVKKMVMIIGICMVMIDYGFDVRVSKNRSHNCFTAILNIVINIYIYIHSIYTTKF